MPRPALRLRRFRLADAAVVAPWLRGPGLDLPPGRAGTRWAERLVANPRLKAWLALVGGEPVAFARLDIGPDRVAELTLAVADAQRRRGVGTALLQAVLVKAQRRRLRRLQAVVDRANAPALQFFSENGFEDWDGGGTAARFVRWIHGADRKALEIEG